jgi:hypothetical protein
MVVVGKLLVGCAGISCDKSVIKRAREFANANGVDSKKYAATVHERGDEYYIFFERRGWFHAMGDHFMVQINKRTGECTLATGQ